MDITPESAKISLCITCKGRQGHIDKTLAKNLADNADFPDVQIILLTYGDKKTADHVKIEFADAIKNGRLLLAEHYPSHDDFIFPHAKNMAHRIAAEHGRFKDSENHILCNLDADNFTGKGFAKYLAEYFNKKDSSFMCNSLFLRGSSKEVDVMSETFRGTEGRLAVKKKDFYSVNGYDEKFSKSWGPDDVQLVARLMKKLLKIPKLIAVKFLDSLPHGDELRTKFSGNDNSTKQQSEGFLVQMKPGTKIKAVQATIVRNLPLFFYKSVSSPALFGCGDVTITSEGITKEVEITGKQAATYKSGSTAKAVDQMERI